MELSFITRDQMTIVTILGDIDGKTAGEIQAEIEPRIQMGSRLLLNMQGVEYMSSAGLRMLLSMYRQALKNEGRLALVGLSENIRDVMAMTGFLNHFTVCSTIEEGLTALQGESSSWNV